MLTKGFDLLSNCLHLFFKQIMEITLNNLYVDIVT